jgi:hypothetical protein
MKNRHKQLPGFSLLRSFHFLQRELRWFSCIGSAAPLKGYNCTLAGI